MPCWASRITLEVTEVWVERLQEISSENCLAEGIVATKFWQQVRPDDLVTPNNPDLDESINAGWENYIQVTFSKLWDSIYAKKGLGWDKNPWVWVIKFKVVDINS